MTFCMLITLEGDLKETFKACMGIFVTQTFALWQFMFLLNVNHASSPTPSTPKKTRFCILFLSSTELTICFHYSVYSFIHCC